jgi:hypothetical protein
VLLLTFCLTGAIVRRDSEMYKFMVAIWVIKDKIVIDAIYGIGLSHLKLAIESLLGELMRFRCAGKKPSRKTRHNSPSDNLSKREVIESAYSLRCMQCRFDSVK